MEVQPTKGTPFHLALPRGYPRRNHPLTHREGQAAWPLLLVLPAPEEAARHPDRHEPDGGLGARIAKQRWPATARRVLDRDWITLTPLPDEGGLIGMQGLRRTHVRDPLHEVWKRYHLDFERLVVDGAEPALRMLESLPSYFAGAVLRGASLEGDAQALACVRNYAHVPLYVVDHPPLATSLRAAGHTNVTEGPADAALTTWMAERCRHWPRSFRWRLQREQQGLAWWVNVDRADWASDAERELVVESIDTAEHPNTIKIEARGVEELSIFLNDEIVDLGRQVRVVINDRVVIDAFSKPAPQHAPLTRDMRTLFLHETLSVRDSRYYGWLMGMVIPRLEVPTSSRKRAPELSASRWETQGPRQLAQAKQLLDGARALVEAGEVAQARRVLDRALIIPRNQHTDVIRKLRRSLDDRR